MEEEERREGAREEEMRRRVKEEEEEEGCSGKVMVFVFIYMASYSILMQHLWEAATLKGCR